LGLGEPVGFLEGKNGRKLNLVSRHGQANSIKGRMQKVMVILFFRKALAKFCKGDRSPLRYLLIQQ
jgi:hypothetical protein